LIQGSGNIKCRLKCVVKFAWTVKNNEFLSNFVLPTTLELGFLLASARMAILHAVEARDT